MRGRRAWLLTGAAAVLMTGCSSAGSADAPGVAPTPAGSTSSGTSASPTSTSASPSSSEDPQAQARADVLAVYATFMDARNKSLNDPRKPPDRRLFKVSIPPARDQAYDLVVYYRQQGIAVHGGTRSNLGALSFSGPVARFEDCLDSTDSKPVFVATGKSALAPNQPRRVVIRVEAALEKGAWWVKRWLPDRGNTC